MKWKSLGHVRLLWPHELYSSWNSPGQNTGVSSLSFLQRVFPTQGSKPGLLHCRWILYQLSQKGSPRILEWVAYPFSSRSSQPTNQTGVSCIAGGFFTNWAVREAHIRPLLVLTWGFPGGSAVKNLPAVQELQEIQVWSLGQEDPLEKGMATHSSILAWRIPWTEKPAGIQSMWSQSWTWLKRLSMH